ncbi:MAG: elongation factor G [Chloroflexi bacterium]|nr:elongation factor G [Chloroflexota bacterium]
MTTKLSNTRNMGFIAHIDAGKTSVSECVLFYTGRTHKAGNIDDGNTVLDWMAQEKERGVTIVSAATSCEWNGFDINIIDTPGHVDFTAEVERSLRVLDGAVVVLDSVAGVQPQSETVWRQANKYNVPRMVFVNKMDKIGADFDRATQTLIDRLSANPVPIQIPIGAEDKFEGIIDLVEQKAIYYKIGDDQGHIDKVTDIPEDLKSKAEEYRSNLIEKVAENDEDFLEIVFSGEEFDNQTFKNAIRRVTISNSIIPIMCGTALKRKAIQPMLDAIGEYLPSPLDVPSVSGKEYRGEADQTRKADDNEPFAALAFKTVSDPYIGRLIYFRVYSGSIDAGAGVLNTITGKKERMGRIVKMHADDREEIKSVRAGDIAAAVGLKDTSTGHTICDENQPIILENITFPEPVVSVSVEPKMKSDKDKLQEALLKMAEEDPTFKVSYNDETAETLISGMGEFHLEIMVDRMKRELNVECNTGKPQVAYRETITSKSDAEGKFIRQSGGRGQYGHCVLEVEPKESGSGFEFVDSIKGGSIPREYIPAVRKGIIEGLTTGNLLGYPVVDIKVNLIDGSFHDVDSSEVAFTIAGSMAVKDAIRKGNPVALEPIMKIEVTTPGDFLGEVIGDLNRRRGQVSETTSITDTQIIKGSVPLGESFGYANTLRSLTQGRASFSMEFERYDQLPKSILKGKMEDQGK